MQRGSIFVGFRSGGLATRSKQETKNARSIHGTRILDEVTAPSQLGLREESADGPPKKQASVSHRVDNRAALGLASQSVARDAR